MKVFKSVLKVVALSALCVVVASPMTMRAYAATSDGVGSWTTSSNSIPLDPTTAAYSGSAAYNGYVYVTGGAGGDGDTVRYAALHSDGSVGSWIMSTSMPYRAFGASTFVYNGYLYNIGGTDFGGVKDGIYYAPLNPDGSVGSWVTSGNVLPQAMRDMAVSVNDGYVYIMGGSSDTNLAQDTVYYAPLNSDGSVGTWVASSNSLPGEIRGARSVIHGNYVYVLGGMGEDYQVDTVYYAPLNPDGSVGTWVVSSNHLPVGVVFSSTVVHDGYIYTMGGAGRFTVQNGVYYAPLNPDGSVGNWVMSSNSLPKGVYGAATSEYNGNVYVIGGYDTVSNYSDSVYYAKLSAPLELPDGSSGSTGDPVNSAGVTVPKVPNTSYVVPARSDPLSMAAITSMMVQLVQG